MVIRSFYFEPFWLSAIAIQYLYVMRQGFYKMVLLLAGIVILAHNLASHFHGDEEKFTHDYQAHDWHHDEDHEIAHTQAVDHAFITDAHFQYDIGPSVAIISPVLYVALNKVPVKVDNDFIISQDESPPPLTSVQYLAFRGPPAV